MFRALRITELNGVFQKKIQTFSFEDLPANEVLVKVFYSALNYKDVLSANGNKGITKQYPHTPGIDATGLVEKTNVAHFSIGDKVLITGYDFGMNTWGGLSEYISVPANWLVKLPKTLSHKEAMIIGTAGFTAALAVVKMLRNKQSHTGEILITGATGGVGSMAIHILSKLNFNAVALTNKKNKHDFLKQIGASKCIQTADFELTNKVLAKPIWHGAIDNLGGKFLETILKTAHKEANIISIGMINDVNLNLNVFPFILNGVNLLGINSADCPYDDRVEVWDKLSKEWKPTCFDLLASEISLQESIEKINQMKEGKVSGRVIVKMMS